MSIPVITILCYLIGEFFKVVILRKKKRYKYIPTIVGGIGGMLGLIIYYVSPDLLFNVTSPFLAVAIGIMSGLASTGGNELIKQIIKKREKEDAVKENFSSYIYLALPQFDKHFYYKSIPSYVFH